MSHNITIEGGTSKRLPVAGKYCDRDIIITATGGGEGGGNSEDLDALVAGTLAELNSNAPSVKAYASHQNTALTSVNLPEATSIGDYAFNECTNLAALSAPKVETIGEYSFYDCQITALDLPLLTTIGTYAFTNNENLETLNVPKLSTAGTYAFRGCTKLQTVFLPVLTGTVPSYFFYHCDSLVSADIPNATNTNNNTFGYCGNLTTVNLPKITAVGSYCFRGCTSLTEIMLPLVTTLNTYAFYQDTALKKADFPVCTTINANAFNGCTVLDTLILRSDTMCKLSATSAFTGTCFANGKSGGKVYVPSALIESYQTATYWKTLYGYGTCEFVALEGSEYE